MRNEIILGSPRNQRASHLPHVLAAEPQLCRQLRVPGGGQQSDQGGGQAGAEGRGGDHRAVLHLLPRDPQEEAETEVRVVL